MLSPHASLGIAQAVFYGPVVPAAIYLFHRNARIRPRMAWWPFIPFSLFRLVGGIITIVAQQNTDNIGLFIAALILLNVGVVPLVVADLGLTRIILMDNYKSNPNSEKIAKGLRLTFVAAIALLASGGGIASVSAKISRILTLIGYVIFAVELLALFSMQLYFFNKRHSFLHSSHKVLTGTLAAFPFLVIRTIYGLLEVAMQTHANNIWSPLTGNVYAFAFMALVPEYIVLGIWMYVGYTIPPRREEGVSATVGRDGGVKMQSQTSDV